MNTLKVSWGWVGKNLKRDDVILGGGIGMMMGDDVWGRGVKNGQKSDDVINGQPLIIKK